MKVAMWALGLVVLSLFGMVLVNLFGNITVTNQLNYTTMKNTVEAAMYDSLDIAHYRAGFCLCTNKAKVGGKWVFNSSDEYKMSDIQYSDGNATCSMEGMSTCEALYGEYRIKDTVFSESLIRRFAEMVNNNKDYVITIQDVIEYPPKVSVRVVSKDEEFSPTEKSSDGYIITNQMDAIIEVKKDTPPTAIITPNITPTPEIKVTPTPKITPTPDDLVCCLNYKDSKFVWVASVKGRCPTGYDNADPKMCQNTPTPKITPTPEIKVTATPTSTATSSLPNTSNTSNCKWHARMYLATWYYNKIPQTIYCRSNSKSIYNSATEAVLDNIDKFKTYAINNCKPKDYEFKAYNLERIDIKGYQYYNVYKYGTKTLLCEDIIASSVGDAIRYCSKCKNINCVARCHN